MRTTISKSGKPRQGVRYVRGQGNTMHKEFDGFSGHFKQTVELIDTGEKRKGKPVYYSQTRHERV